MPGRVQVAVEHGPAVARLPGLPERGQVEAPGRVALERRLQAGLVQRPQQVGHVGQGGAPDRPVPPGRTPPGRQSLTTHP